KTLPHRCHFLLKSNIPIPEIVQQLSNWFESHPGHGHSKEEIKQERLLDVTAIPVAAMANNRGHRSPDMERERCGNCHGLGHRWEQCSQSWCSGAICFNCLGFGHQVDGCPSERMVHDSLPFRTKNNHIPDYPIGRDSRGLSKEKLPLLLNQR
ncbi:hypothetical protein SK128_028256, partial [Halocaridina rubra]